MAPPEALVRQTNFFPAVDKKPIPQPEDRSQTDLPQLRKRVEAKMKVDDTDNYEQARKDLFRDDLRDKYESEHWDR